MNLSLYSAATGMEAQQLNLNTIANNLANVSSRGFKRSKIEFQDMLYQKPRATGAQNGGGNQLPTGIEVGKAMGAVVIASAGGADKLEAAREAGADHLIDYRKEALRARVLEITGGRGADVIYDPVGGDVTDQSLRCIAWNGRHLVIGFASGRIPEVKLNRVLLKNMSVVGLAWGQYLDRGMREPEEAQYLFYDMIERRQIDPVIYQTLPFAETKEGLRIIESREVYGKVVITR